MALPPTPPPLPRSLDREDIDSEHSFSGPLSKGGAGGGFKPFSISVPSGGGASKRPQPPLPLDLPQRPAAPHPNHEPKSVPGSVIAAAANNSSVRLAEKPKNVLGGDDEDEDEGEVKEDHLPPATKAKPPFLPGLDSTPTLPPPRPSQPEAAEDAFEKKIREMEAMQAAPPRVPPAVKVAEVTSGGEKPVQKPAPVRGVVVRRSVEDEKTCYNRVFKGVSRLRLYRKEEKLGEGTFG